MKFAKVRWIVFGIVSFSLPAIVSADEKATCVSAYVNAQTQRTEHKLLSARDTLLICSRRECSPFMRGQLERDCAEWLAQVQAAIPTVVLAAQTSTGPITTPVAVYIDGVAVTDAASQSPIEVDPGPHVFTFASEGVRIDSDAVIFEGGKGQQVFGVFDAEALAASSNAAARAERGPGWEAPGPRMSILGPYPARTLVPLGIGAVGFVFGTVFGVLALSNKSTLDEYCNNGHCAPPASQGDVDALHVNSWISNIGFGVGIAGVATAAAFWIGDRSGAARKPRTTGRNIHVEPWVGPASLGISGRFQ